MEQIALAVAKPLHTWKIFQGVLNVHVDYEEAERLSRASDSPESDQKLLTKGQKRLLMVVRGL